MKSLILNATLVVLLGLVASTAMADECKPIQARIGPSTYLDPCSYQGTEYSFCIDAPIMGTINGTWHYYGQEEDGVALFPEPPYASLLAGWALDVFETNKGMIYAQDTWLWNLSVFDLDGTQAVIPVVTLSTITGGTGKYEGASGWMGLIFDDQGDWKGFMKGEICTPGDDGEG